jgi:GR25 family glycosyltransferase involved in LPS biosynthesis
MITVAKKGESDSQVIKSADDTKTLFPDHEVEICYYQKHPRMPTRGCAESHAETMRKVQNDEAPYSLILEDDVVWDKSNFSLKDINEFLARETPDILYLGCFPMFAGPYLTKAGVQKGFAPKQLKYVPGIKSKIPVSVANTKFYRSSPLALHAYIINKKTAKEIADWVDSLDKSLNVAIDAYTAMNCNDKWRCHSIHPMAAFQHNPKKDVFGFNYQKFGMKAAEFVFGVGDKDDKYLVLFYVGIGLIILVLIIGAVFLLKKPRLRKQENGQPVT